MPKGNSASSDKTYKPNPSPVKGPDPTGWDKAKFGDNRDLKEANDNDNGGKT